MAVKVKFTFGWDGGLTIPENRGLMLTPSFRFNGVTTTDEAEAWCIENDVQINEIGLVGKNPTEEAHAFMTFETEEGAAKYMMVFCG